MMAALIRLSLNSLLSYSVINSSQFSTGLWRASFILPGLTVSFFQKWRQSSSSNSDGDSSAQCLYFMMAFVFFSQGYCSCSLLFWNLCILESESSSQKSSSISSLTLSLAYCCFFSPFPTFCFTISSLKRFCLSSLISFTKLFLSIRLLNFGGLGYLLLCTLMFSLSLGVERGRKLSSLKVGCRYGLNSSCLSRCSPYSKLEKDSEDSEACIVMFFLEELCLMNPTSFLNFSVIELYYITVYEQCPNRSIARQNQMSSNKLSDFDVLEIYLLM